MTTPTEPTIPISTVRNYFLDKRNTLNEQYDGLKLMILAAMEEGDYYGGSGNVQAAILNRKLKGFVDEILAAVDSVS